MVNDVFFLYRTYKLLCDGLEQVVSIVNSWVVSHDADVSMFIYELRDLSIVEQQANHSSPLL